MKRAVLPLLLLAGCAAPPPIPNQPLEDDAYTSLRTQVTAMVSPHCGSCHTTGSPEAKPAALSIFDLAKDTWPSDLWADDHALSFQRRIAGKLDEQEDAALADLLGAARFRTEDR